MMLVLDPAFLICEFAGSLAVTLTLQANSMTTATRQWRRAGYPRDQLLDRGDRFALAPQMISEFTHVVCDSRRFEEPLTRKDALNLAESWWKANDVDQVFPIEKETLKFFDLVAKHQLGRKRIRDTFLAAT